MITKGYRALLDEAMAEVRTITASEALAIRSRDNVTFVDIRDIRELEREGRLEGAVHAPRGMLEFWVDPESPYHKPIFAENKTFVLFCAAGWRSALAAKTLQDMGFDNVMHVQGGFGALQALLEPSGGNGQ